MGSGCKHGFGRRGLSGRTWLAILAVAGALCPLAQAVPQLEFDKAPIWYSAATVHDRVARLQEQLDAGTAKLEYDAEHGYLPSVLAALGISPSSQMLVFSKTSFQLRKISPQTPRALYFNDDVYVGWVPDGEVIEVSAVDPQQGAIFYTLDQALAERPKFLRDQGNCLTCHASARTSGVPGYVVRSVYPAPSGQPHYGAGTFHTNHASPFTERWGGWYVSGTHGRQRHMGNVTSAEREPPFHLDQEAGANRTDLRELVNLDRYLTSHSDLVALLVLEHQAGLHNLITFANFETRMAQHHDQRMNEALERPPEHVSETTERRIAAAVENLVRYLLFADEVQLSDPVAGTADFAEKFAALGPRDEQGRSLRDLDLQQRMFKYRCSYLIYSESFLQLPAVVKQLTYRRLWEILTGRDSSQEFTYLHSDERQAIREILLATHPDLPDYWRTSE